MRCLQNWQGSEGEHIRRLLQLMLRYWGQLLPRWDCLQTVQRALRDMQWP